MLLDEDVQGYSNKIDEHYHSWFCTDTKQSGINALMEFESTVSEFRNYVAKRYKIAQSERGQITG